MITDDLSASGIHIGLTVDEYYYSSTDGAYVGKKTYVPARSKKTHSLYFAVLGQHGSEEVGRYVHDHLCEIITEQEQFHDGKSDENVLEAIRNGFQICQKMLRKKYYQEEWNVLSGTTVTAVFLRGKKMYVAHVGDGKVVVIDDYLKERILTEDHVASKEVKRIEKAGGKLTTEGRIMLKVTPPGHRGPILRRTVLTKIPYHRLSRSLGDFWSYNFAMGKSAVSSEPDTKVVQLCPNRDRFIVLANGQVWKSIDIRAVGRIVYNEPNAAKQLSELCDPVHAASVIVITLDKPIMGLCIAL